MDGDDVEMFLTCCWERGPAVVDGDIVVLVPAFAAERLDAETLVVKGSMWLT